MRKQLKRISKLQERLYAENKQSLLIVLQAMDTGGKDGTIGGVFEGVNPEGCRVWSFKAPTPEELAHDFLWRIHQKTPERGMINIFNRSHYEDVLVVRVHELVPQGVWEKRYDLINNFELLLHENNTAIIKFYLHISKDEQKQRLEARRDTPENSGNSTQATSLSALAGRIICSPTRTQSISAQRVRALVRNPGQ